MTAAHREETPRRRRFRLVAALLLLAGTAGPAAADGCAARDDLTGPCFRLRGRAALSNGNPTVRVWRVGTRRLLGVSARRCEPPACEPLPADLRAALDWEHPVFADFVVCPLTPSRPGVMQMVCIASATRLRRWTDPSH